MRFGSVKTKTTVLVATGLTAAAVVAGSGVALAGPGFGNNNIHGCIGADGRLRVAETCRRGELGIDWQAKGKDGKNGANGKNGLDGVPGADGKNGLDGKDGAEGRPGPAGKDGLNGSGALGPVGPHGAPGVNGKDGVDGASAFDLWLASGRMGEVSDFLSSLVGDKGDAGAKGDTGDIGLMGERGETGTKGDAGLKGDTGLKGDAGADGRGFTFRGAWSPTNSYAAYDVVTYQGSSFFVSEAIAPGDGSVTPSNGGPLYVLLAAKGAAASTYKASVNADGTPRLSTTQEARLAPSGQGGDATGVYDVFLPGDPDLQSCSILASLGPAEPLHDTARWVRAYITDGANNSVGAALPPPNLLRIEVLAADGSFVNGAFDVLVTC